MLARQAVASRGTNKASRRVLGRVCASHQSPAKSTPSSSLTLGPAPVCTAGPWDSLRGVYYVPDLASATGTGLVRGACSRERTRVREQDPSPGPPRAQGLDGGCPAPRLALK